MTSWAPQEFPQLQPHYVKEENYMNGNSFTIVGRLTDDPELRYTPGGNAVSNFTIASTPRVYSQTEGKYVDGNPVFMRCKAWNEFAENVAESFHRGDRVIAVGTVTQRTYENKDKEKRTVTEVTVDEMGASVKFATVDVKKSVGHQKSEPEPEPEPQKQAESRRSRR